MLPARGRAAVANGAAHGELALPGSMRSVRGTPSLAQVSWRSGVTALWCAAEAAPRMGMWMLARHGVLLPAAHNSPPERSSSRR